MPQVSDVVRRAQEELIESQTKSTSGPKDRLHHDFETFSTVDLTKTGTDVYARHPDTEILMCAHAINDDTPDIWVPVEGEEIPSELEEAIEDPNVIKFAWNKPFEWHIWKHVYGVEIPHTLWRDPMVMAMTLSLPGKLEKAGDIIGIDEDKKKIRRGKALMRKFSMPRKPTKTLKHTRVHWHMEPEDWEEYKEYCIGDVEAERAVWKKIRRYTMPMHEWSLWVLDQVINQNGIPIDSEMVDNAVAIYEHIRTDRMARMIRLTGLENPNSNVQLLPWLKEHGYPFDDLKKGHVERAVVRCDEEMTENFDDPAIIYELEDLKEVLELRLEANASSPKKFHSLQRSVAEDGLLRNCFQFAGAQRTWRWAGRMLQPQNLPRPEREFEDAIEFYANIVKHHSPENIDFIFNDPMGLLKSCIRPVARAPEGKLFIDADLNAIENRVLGWIADDRKILEVFEKGQDPYIAFAQYMFHRTYEDLWHDYKENGDKEARTTAKPGVLGCGYMLGAGEERVNRKTGEIEATGLLGYAWNMGVKLTHDESALSVKVFRETFSEVKDFWYAIEKAMKKCIRTGKKVEFRMFEFDIKGPFCRIRLPSGRYLHYCRPRLEDKKTPWGEMRPTITYEGLNAQGQWVRIQTHPGKITENVDQAISRDLLAHGMMLAHKEGLDIRLHVHDQIVGLSDEDRADKELAILQDCMRSVPLWCPGMPLDSAGFTSKVFTKD